MSYVFDYVLGGIEGRILYYAYNNRREEYEAGKFTLTREIADTSYLTDRLVHVAVKADATWLLKDLVKSVPSCVNDTGKEGQTAVHLAGRLGLEQCLHILLGSPNADTSEFKKIFNSWTPSIRTMIENHGTPLLSLISLAHFSPSSPPCLLVFTSSLDAC